MEESTSDSLGGGAIIEDENGTIATNLQRSRSIPEPISDSHDIHNSGTNYEYFTFNPIPMKVQWNIEIRV